MPGLWPSDFIMLSCRTAAVHDHENSQNRMVSDHPFTASSSMFPARVSRGTRKACPTCSLLLTSLTQPSFQVFVANVGLLHRLKPLEQQLAAACTPNNPFNKSQLKALAPLECLSNCVISSPHYQPRPHNLTVIIRGQCSTRTPVSAFIYGCSHNEQKLYTSPSLCVLQMLIMNLSFFSHVIHCINQNAISFWL